MTQDELDELLALLPDNTTGEISAADMRTIVTELYNMGSIIGQGFSYLWVTTPGPGAGKVTLDQGWTMSSTVLQVSETTEDGENLLFTFIDDVVEKQVWLSTTTGARFRATITGPSVDQGGYRDLPITPTLATGTPPTGSQKISLAFFLRVL